MHLCTNFYVYMFLLLRDAFHMIKYSRVGGGNKRENSEQYAFDFSMFCFY